MGLGIFFGPIIFFLFLWFLGLICTSIVDYFNGEIKVEKKILYEPDPWWWRVIVPEIYEELEKQKTQTYISEVNSDSFANAIMWADLGND